MKKRRKKKSKLLPLITLLVAIGVVGIGAFTFNYYTENSYLSLKGDTEMNVGLHSIFEDPGVDAKLGGFDVSDQVKAKGQVDTDTPGTYTLEYKSGNFTKERTVIVADKMNPSITLKGEDVITVKLGETVEEPGYVAEAEDGSDLTSQVEVSEMDLTRAGTEKVSYTVSDSKGNKTRIYRSVTIEPNTEYENPGLPICMFHYVYDENDPPADLENRYGNYIGAQALTEELEWLNSEGYYYPSWDEVRDYIDGKLLLPEKSVVLTFDDGSKSFLKCGIPVLEKCKVPATSFMITSHHGEKKIAEYQSDYVTYQSHSDDMHRTGGNIGHGGIFTAISYEDGMADLKKSIEITGHGDAFAYPYGDFNDSSIQMVKDAGFKCAVTTQPGKVHPGDDPYLLNRQRMSLRQSLEAFQSMVRP